MKLSEMAREVKGARLVGGDAEILSLCRDSRMAGEGDVFFCYRGTRSDSHCFAQEAEKRGAAAIVAERDTGVSCPQLIVPDGREAMARLAAGFYAHPERKMKIVGVTGTNGKTTTTYLLKNILGEAGIKTGVIGTLGAEYGICRLAPSLTTPDPDFLFSLLADMQRDGVECVCMEVSAHALALKKEIPIVYDVGIFTNLTRDHLDFFKSFERYGAAKKEMFEEGRCRYAVLNADDPFSKQLMKGAYMTYGMNTPADCFAVIEEESLTASRFMLNLLDELVESELPMAGRHNVMNALAAATAARQLGAHVNAIAAGLSKCVGVNGRLERVGSLRGGDVFVDFAHTPDGLKKSLEALRPHCRGRLIVLFGCGGNRDAGKRKLMGETAARYADFSVLTSDNPRYEDPCAILSDIEEGHRALSKKYVAVEDREKATEYAIGMLREGDVLLVAGKGGEDYQEIMGIKYSYDDKDVIKEIFRKMQ